MVNTPQFVMWGVITNQQMFSTLKNIKNWGCLLVNKETPLKSFWHFAAVISHLSIYQKLTARSEVFDLSGLYSKSEAVWVCFPLTSATPLSSSSNHNPSLCFRQLLVRRQTCKVCSLSLSNLRRFLTGEIIQYAEASPLTVKAYRILIKQLELKPAH